MFTLNLDKDTSEGSQQELSSHMQEQAAETKAEASTEKPIETRLESIKQDLDTLEKDRHGMLLRMDQLTLPEPDIADTVDAEDLALDTEKLLLKENLKKIEERIHILEREREEAEAELQGKTIEKGKEGTSLMETIGGQSSEAARLEEQQRAVPANETKPRQADPEKKAKAIAALDSVMAGIAADELAEKKAKAIGALDTVMKGIEEDEAMEGLDAITPSMNAADEGPEITLETRYETDEEMRERFTRATELSQAIAGFQEEYAKPNQSPETQNQTLEKWNAAYAEFKTLFPDAKTEEDYTTAYDALAAQVQAFDQKTIASKETDQAPKSPETSPESKATGVAIDEKDLQEDLDTATKNINASQSKKSELLAINEQRVSIEELKKQLPVAKGALESFRSSTYDLMKHPNALDVGSWFTNEQIINGEYAKAAQATIAQREQDMSNKIALLEIQIGETKGRAEKAELQRQKQTLEARQTDQIQKHFTFLRYHLPNIVNATKAKMQGLEYDLKQKEQAVLNAEKKLTDMTGDASPSVAEAEIEIPVEYDLSGFETSTQASASPTPEQPKEELAAIPQLQEEAFSMDKEKPIEDKPYTLDAAPEKDLPYTLGNGVEKPIPLVRKKEPVVTASEQIATEATPESTAQAPSSPEKRAAKTADEKLYEDIGYQPTAEQLAAIKRNSSLLQAESKLNTSQEFLNIQTEGVYLHEYLKNKPDKEAALAEARANNYKDVPGLDDIDHLELQRGLAGHKVAQAKYEYERLNLLLRAKYGLITKDGKIDESNISKISMDKKDRDLIMAASKRLDEAKAFEKGAEQIYKMEMERMRAEGEESARKSYPDLFQESSAATGAKTETSGSAAIAGKSYDNVAFAKTGIMEQAVPPVNNDVSIDDQDISTAKTQAFRTPSAQDNRLN